MAGLCPRIDRPVQAGVECISGEPIDTSISERTAGLFKGRIVFTRDEDGRYHPAWKHRGFGLATAISEYGHFLTAAHCVSDKDGLYLTLFSDSELNNKPIRAVWVSDEYDIALIHVEQRLKKYYDVEPHLPTIESTVLLGGNKGGNSTGHILSTGDAESNGIVYHTIHHTCPGVPGDSGGPLLSQRGSY